MSDPALKKAAESLPTDLLGAPPAIIEKKRGGRPAGSKDSRKRKPLGVELVKVSETKDKRLTKRDLLFSKEIERLGFDTSFELLQHYEILVKSLHSKIDKKTGVLSFDKEVQDRVWQVSDILKSIASLQFAKLKAVELNPSTADRVQLNFNLNAAVAQVIPTEENKALPMFQQADGSFQLPIPS